MNNWSSPGDRGRDDLAISLGLLPPAHDDVDFEAHPAHRHELADDGLAAVLSSWSHAAAGLDVIDPDPLCTLCGDTGLYTHRDYLSGQTVTSTCPGCDGGARW